MESRNDQIKHSTATDVKPPVVCRYYHPCVGYGDFVREYNGPYGLGLIIRLDNGREWFAPINEFTRADNGTQRDTYISSAQIKNLKIKYKP